MPDREPEPWESSAAAPFLWIETPPGNVEVWGARRGPIQDHGARAQQAGQKTAPGVARHPGACLGPHSLLPLHARLRPYRSRPARALRTRLGKSQRSHVGS
jgi:hypothetical protein